MKSILLIDSIGAAFSATVLFVIYLFLSSVAGLPALWLLLLAVIAVTLSCLSLVFALHTKNQHTGRLVLVATLNIAYCLLTLAIVFSYREQLHWLLAIYLPLEALIILVLAFFEMKLAIKHSNSIKL